MAHKSVCVAKRKKRAAKFVKLLAANMEFS